MNNTNQVKIIKLPEVIHLTKQSKSAIYDGMSKGVFPKSFLISLKSIGWLETDILSFIQALAQEKSQNEIRELVKELELNRLGGIL
jgi:predicted DNA-binding transcriptional regulator AlpA